MAKLFLITGVNGIGKSTLTSLLSKKLNNHIFDIHDFDERGVPTNADKSWRQSEITHWIIAATENQKIQKNTVICGFMKFAEIQNALASLGAQAKVCLLDANDETISKRILERYTSSESVQELERTTSKTPEKFCADNVWVASQFRMEAKELGYHIVDTSSLSPGKVCSEIIDWIEFK